MIAATLKACSIFALKKAGRHTQRIGPISAHRSRVTTIVATEGGDVCGFWHSDGEIQAHLSVLAVKAFRRQGIGQVDRKVSEAGGAH